MADQIQDSPKQSTTGGITYGRLKRCHPRLNLGRVRVLHALYRGGVHLLGDDAVMDYVFGKIGDESDQIYNERKRRAFYENLFALVVNQISAGLAQDPCHIAQAKSGKPEDAADASSMDDYWPELMKNASVNDDDGSEQRTFDQIERDTVVEALTCGWSWSQVDLPATPSPDDPDVDAPNSLNEQEQSGGLRAYVVTWPTDAVTDWEEINGKLIWVRTYETITQSLDPSSPRWPDKGGVRVHRWTIWTPGDWTRYEIEETQENPLSAWNDDRSIPKTGAGSHSFGRVPWIRLDLCSSGTYLHVGDLIESLCRVYFNRTNGESWQWTQNCFQQLYEFLAPEMAGIDAPISNAQMDPSRAKKQRRAPGVVHERGEGDRAEYVAPDMSGADIGAKATQDLRDAILRVTAQMALAQDTSGAMLRRSADSKAQDSIPQEIVLGAVGKRLLIHANQVAKLCAIGRGDDPDDAPLLEGYERFDVDDASNLINDTVLLDAVDIPSARYQVEAKFRVAVAHLGDNADQDVLSEIREQLESAITQDQIENPPMPPELAAAAGIDPNDPDADPDDPDAQAKNPDGTPAQPAGKPNPFGGKPAGGKPPPFGKKPGGGKPPFGGGAPKKKFPFPKK